PAGEQADGGQAEGRIVLDAGEGPAAVAQLVDEAEQVVAEGLLVEVDRLAQGGRVLVDRRQHAGVTGRQGQLLRAQRVHDPAQRRGRPFLLVKHRYTIARETVLDLGGVAAGVTRPGP